MKNDKRAKTVAAVASEADTLSPVGTQSIAPAILRLEYYVGKLRFGWTENASPKSLEKLLVQIAAASIQAIDEL